MPVLTIVSRKNVPNLLCGYDHLSSYSVLLIQIRFDNERSFSFVVGWHNDIVTVTLAAADLDVDHASSWRSRL